jgi:AraC-like DNA-binding protein
MPSSEVRTFTDPDEYSEFIRGSKTELTIVERGNFEAKLVRISLHHLWMQRFYEKLPRIMHWNHASDRTVISLRTKPGPDLVSNGFEMYPSNIIRRRRAQEYFQRSEGFACFGAISLPNEQMASVGVMAGYDLTAPKNELTITPSNLQMAQLLDLHETAGHFAEYASDLIANPEAARGLEQALIAAMVHCLGTAELVEDRSSVRQHAAIIRRFRRVVEENPDQALFIPELCKAIGASERTLRVCCQEQLGMSPKRYLFLRRMRLVRQGLRESVPTNATVTDIATQYAFWNLGRFAGEYKALFDELPSATLARPLSRAVPF